MAVEISIEGLQGIYEKGMDKIKAVAYGPEKPGEFIYYEPVFGQQRKGERHKGEGYAAHALPGSEQTQRLIERR